ncbi:MAG: hypothetical protein ACI94L_000007 [Flavobacteriaceae bacterium]|jgi:hypothetical protein
MKNTGAEIGRAPLSWSREKDSAWTLYQLHSNPVIHADLLLNH